MFGFFPGKVNFIILLDCWGIIKIWTEKFYLTLFTEKIFKNVFNEKFFSDNQNLTLHASKIFLFFDDNECQFKRF